MVFFEEDLTELEAAVTKAASVWVPGRMTDINMRIGGRRRIPRRRERNLAFSTYSIVGPIVSPYGYGAAKNRLNEICKGQVMKLFNSEAKKNLFETQYAFAENELVDDSVFADRENIPSMIGAVIGLTG